MSLLRQTQGDLKNLGPADLAPTGRIEAFKMLILPKILYLFRTVPIDLPLSFFRKFQSIFSQYIWAGKRPRCAFSTLVAKRLAGSMGTPDLKIYHSAVQLDQIKYWWNSTPEKQWSIMEAAQLEAPNTRAQLIAVKLGLVLTSAGYPTIDATLKTWINFSIPNRPDSTTITTDIPLTTLQYLIADLNP